MSFIFFILFALVFAFIFVVVLAANVLNVIFGGLGNILKFFGVGSNTRQDNRNERQEMGGGRQTVNPSSNSKIFAADEGEYVDFEEIKN